MDRHLSMINSSPLPKSDNHEMSSSGNSSLVSRWILPFRWSRSLSTFGWFRGFTLESKKAIKLALGISTFVLLSNMIILLVASINYGGFRDGMAVLQRGSAPKISHLTTVYHIIINTLSTGLLTSSSYCMQLLCSPTRADIDRAHSKRQWLDIGILSWRNLKSISSRKATLWIILAISSLPLHLIYNSAILTTIRAQDYSIHFVSSSDPSILNKTVDAGYSKLTNQNWKSRYDTEYLSNARDLHLIFDKALMSIQMSGTTGWSLINSVPFDINDNWIEHPWKPAMDEIQINLQLNTSTMQTQNITLSSDPIQRVSIEVAEFNSTNVPKITFPDSLLIDASTYASWKRHIVMNKDSWCSRQDSRALPVHVQYGLSEELRDGSTVQVALPFMLIVIICNMLKVVAIWCTLRQDFSSIILTQGDAVASFLEVPDVTTVGKCMLDKRAILKNLRDPLQEDGFRWRASRQLRGHQIKTQWISNTYIMLTGVMIIVIMVFAIISSIALQMDSLTKGDEGSKWAWATNSKTQFRWSFKSANTQGFFLNAIVTNAPQILLSVFYIAWNRVCTTFFFSLEWNNHGLIRKGLRVTTPHEGSDQRPAYFLQLPYKWAIPLISMSGLLHWLLSQSFFLIRIDVYDRDGILQPQRSKSTCGYSSLSLLVFCSIFLLILAGIYKLSRRPFQVCIPITVHCSFAISAACHPPPDDIDPYLKPVQWGVVNNRFKGNVEHCTFTSEEVKEPQDGHVYA